MTSFYGLGADQIGLSAVKVKDFIYLSPLYWLLELRRVREILIRSHSFISFCGSWILLKHKGSGYRSLSKIKKIEIENKICLTFVQVVSDVVKLQIITKYHVNCNNLLLYLPNTKQQGLEFYKAKYKNYKNLVSGSYEA